jgi:hypothetical protein
MTYRQLRKQLQEMDDFRLDDPAVIYNHSEDEYEEVRYIIKIAEEPELEDQFIMYT